MKDWKGNIIRSGDTVVVYQFVIRNPTLEYIVYDGEKWVSGFVPNSKRKDKYVWNEITRVEVTDGGTIKFGETTQCGASHLSLCINPFENECVCIKGLSDNRQKFMEHYFEV